MLQYMSCLDFWNFVSVEQGARLVVGLQRTQVALLAGSSDQSSVPSSIMSSPVIDNALLDGPDSPSRALVRFSAVAYQLGVDVPARHDDDDITATLKSIVDKIAEELFVRMQRGETRTPLWQAVGDAQTTSAVGEYTLSNHPPLPKLYFENTENNGYYRDREKRKRFVVTDPPLLQTDASLLSDAVRRFSLTVHEKPQPTSFVATSLSGHEIFSGHPLLDFSHIQTVEILQTVRPKDPPCDRQNVRPTRHGTTEDVGTERQRGSDDLKEHLPVVVFARPSPHYPQLSGSLWSIYGRESLRFWDRPFRSNSALLPALEAALLAKGHQVTQAMIDMLSEAYPDTVRFQRSQNLSICAEVDPVCVLLPEEAENDYDRASVDLRSRTLWGVAVEVEFWFGCANDVHVDWVLCVTMDEGGHFFFENGGDFLWDAQEYGNASVFGDRPNCHGALLFTLGFKDGVLLTTRESFETQATGAHPTHVFSTEVQRMLKKGIVSGGVGQVPTAELLTTFVVDKFSFEDEGEKSRYAAGLRSTFDAAIRVVSSPTTDPFWTNVLARVGYEKEQWERVRKILFHAEGVFAEGKRRDNDRYALRYALDLGTGTESRPVDSADTFDSTKAEVERAHGAAEWRFFITVATEYA